MTILKLIACMHFFRLFVEPIGYYIGVSRTKLPPLSRNSTLEKAYKQYGRRVGSDRIEVSWDEINIQSSVGAYEVFWCFWAVEVFVVKSILLSVIETFQLPQTTRILQLPQNTKYFNSPKTPEYLNYHKTPEYCNYPKTPEYFKCHNSPEYFNCPKTQEYFNCPNTPEYYNYPKTPEYFNYPKTPEYYNYPKTPEYFNYPKNQNT